MRTAVYTGSRTLYGDMVTAAKSLLCNSNVEKIYFCIQDDEFPEWLPPVIETRNISGQTFFPEGGVNFNSPFTYMVLMRTCFTKLFPDLDRILSLDVDTIVDDDISPLWDIGLNGKWFAAVNEDFSNYKPYGPIYYNAGVMMFNLDQIRKDKADDKIISWLNLRKTPYADQDAWNRFGLDKAVRLPNRYNESLVTGFSEDPAVIHFAAYKEWRDNPRVPRREYLKKYRCMTWEEVLSGKNTDSRPDI